jgi:hypothetical protein
MRKHFVLAALVFLMMAVAAEASTQAWVFGNNPAAAAYVPIASRAFNPSGGPIGISHPGAGQYIIRFGGLAPFASNGLAPFPGNVQVTANGGGPSYCAIASWGNAGADVVINIRCFNPAGVPTNMLYTVLYTFN